MPALKRRAARIIRVSTVRGFVVRAHHLDRLSCFQVVKTEIDGSTTIVTRAFRRIRYEYLLVVGRCVPKDFGDVPRSITIMDQQAITQRLQPAADADQGFGRSALQKRAWL